MTEPQSIAGNPAPREAAYRVAISEELVVCCQRSLGESLRALLLTGSVARGEETACPGRNGTVLRSDVECLAVLHDGYLRPPESLVRALCLDVEKTLLARGIHCHVGLSAVHAAYLRQLPPHIFSCELRTCGEVLCGEQGILELIPAISADQIDREDAWRILSNRMIEQLEALGREPSADAAEELQYRTLKLCLDLGTSLLVFRGQYEAGYAARARRFEELAKAGDTSDAPFASASFAALLHECTGAKLNQQPLRSRPAEQFPREIGRFAHQAWLWEIREMLGQPDGDPQVLLRHLARRKGMWRRVRGWAYCLRHCGWILSFSNWPRWMRLGMRYSPRDAIYLAAFLLHSRWLQERSGDASAAEDLRWIAALLPLRGAWRGALTLPLLAAEIGRNYWELVVETRA